jgi:hypothetical protein
MRIVAEEQHRIQADANVFCDTIQGFVTKLIYES